jgi:hypothetical protein
MSAVEAGLMTARLRPSLNSLLLISKKLKSSQLLRIKNSISSKLSRQTKRLSTSQRRQRATIRSPRFIPMETPEASPVVLRITSCPVLITYLRTTNSNSKEMMSLILQYFYKSYRKRKKLQILILSIESTLKRRKRSK